jgi:mannosyltransferase
LRLAGAAALFAVALSCAARLWLLAARPLWHDEVFTVWASRLTPGGLIRVLSHDSGPPLFYLLEKPFVAAAESLGLSDGVARLLPFLALFLLFAGARSLPRGGPRGRFLLLAASSPFLLLYAAEARAYALVALLGLALFLLAVQDAQGTRRIALIALTTAMLLWTHYLAIFVVASLLVVTVIQRRRRSAFGIGAGAALFLPWLPVLLAQPEAATAWIREPVRDSAVGFLAALGGGIRVPAPLGLPLPEPLLFLACAAGIVLLVSLLVLRPSQPQARAGRAMVLLTLGGILAASFWRSVAFAGRSEMVVLPIWLWLLSGFSKESAAVRRGLGAVAAIAAASSLLLICSPRPVRHDAALVARVQAEARGGDLVVATANLYLPARLARDRGRLAADLRALPADLEDHPGWFLSRPLSEADYRRLAQDIARVKTDRSVFLLLDPAFWTPNLQQILAARGPFRALARFPEAMAFVSPGRRSGGG